MKKSKSQPKPTGHYDDALPERMLEAQADIGGVRRVALSTEATEPSPYIVKLTRPGQDFDDTRIEPAHDFESLKRGLILDYDDVLEDAPAPAVRLKGAKPEDDLRLTIQDLRAQLLEDDDREEVVPVILPTRPQTQVHDDALPIDIWSETQPIDVVAAIDVTAPEPTQSVWARVSNPTVIEDEPKAPPRRHRDRGRLLILNLGWQRALASFVGLALVLVVPLHTLQVLADVKADGGDVAAGSQAALSTFLRGATSLSEQDFNSAGADFDRAAAGFADAEASLDDLHAGVLAVASVIPETDKTVDSARGLVTAGKELSETASVMSLAASDLADKQSLDLTTKLELLGTYIDNALPHLQIAQTALAQVDPAVVPADYQSKVLELQTRVPQLSGSLQEYLTFVDTLSTIMGGERKMRYLAMFQNNTELRATGGFMGSFAELDVSKGEIVRMFVPGGGTYDVQGQLRAFVAAPGPMQLLRARWEFQDANWFPDFPSSAKKLQWFYGQSGGPTSDAVVAVNATFVAELLNLLGPVDMPEYGRTFDAENFLFETQKIVELEYDQAENAPKEIIGDLAPILLERIRTADLPTMLAAVDLIAKGLHEKDILISFSDNELQAQLETLGWTGSLKQTSGDYFMMVDTNLGGGKTDGVIDQDIDLNVKVDDTGSVTNTVTITKTHRGMKNALFTGSNNVDYLRVYVPKGSQLISAQGFEIPDDELFETSDIPLGVDEDLMLHLQNLHKDETTGTDIWEEDGKTVFGNWMQTASGETEVVSFTYSLPFKVVAEKSTSPVMKFAEQALGRPSLSQYSLLIQKQPGVVSRDTTVKLNLPSELQAVWNSQDDPQLTSFSTDNAADAFAAWLFESK